MSGKTISTGTLGLRFMQNAQRAKHLQEVEAERAHIKDEAEWEVDQMVRDAWGVSSSSSSSQNVTHETSYLPFLFPSLEQSTDPSSTERPKGRRAFNRKGEEIIQKESEPVVAQTEGQKAPHSATKKSRVHPHPVSISGGSGTLSGFPQQPMSTKTAKEAIYDNTGVGADLRAKPTPSVPGFLKPSGVDEPSAPVSKYTKPGIARNMKRSPQKSVDAASTSAETDIIPGARGKKVKRERSTTDQAEGEGTKPKKKKSIS